MACGPITSWQTRVLNGHPRRNSRIYPRFPPQLTEEVSTRGNNGNSGRLYFLGLQNHADGDCSHEIKRCLVLGRNATTNLNNMLKSRDIILPTEVHLVKAVFSSSHVWMWGLDCKESWALKNWCFWTVVLEKTLEIPLDCKEINQEIWKEISPEYPLEGLMLKLKLQSLASWGKELTHWRRPLCWTRLKSGEWDDRG